MPRSWHYHQLEQDIRAILRTLASHLDASQIAEVEHYLEHGEYGEALHTLAWVLVEDNRRVPAAVLREIARLADAMGTREELPPTLDQQAQ